MSPSKRDKDRKAKAEANRKAKPTPRQIYNEAVESVWTESGAPVKRLPKAKPLDVTRLRQDIDIDNLRDQVSLLEGHVNDNGKRIAQVEGSADYWAGVSARVKTLEDALAKPPTTIVEQASGMSIAWCLLVNDLIFGAVIGVWWYWPAIKPLFDVAKH